MLGAFLAGPAEGQDAEAVADLVLAALQQSADPQQSLGTAISVLLPPEHSEGLPNGRGHTGEAPASQTDVSIEQDSIDGVHREPSQAVHSLAGPEEDVILEDAVIERSAVHLPGRRSSRASSGRQFVVTARESKP